MWRSQILVKRSSIWIAFVLLALIGGNMIHEALDNDEEEADASLDVKTMFLLAVATSIDALAIGITFAFLKVNIIPAVCFIGIVTFIISFAGVKIGNVFGARYKNKAEIPCIRQRLQRAAIWYQRGQNTF